MKPRRLLKLLKMLMGGLLVFPVAASADSAFSRVVGYNVVPCPGGSDTIVSVPFRRPSSFLGKVSGTPVVDSGSAILTAAGTPAFAGGEFTGEAHYLLFTGTGTRSGWHYPVTGHDASTVTIDLEGDILSGVADGDSFEVVPFWTLGTLFPKDTQTAIHVSEGKLSATRKSRVLFFDDTSGGIKLAPDRVCFLTAEGWFHSRRGFPAADDVIIRPGSSFVIRHPVVEAVTTFYPLQVVVTEDQSLNLKTRSEGSQDNALALVRPVPVKLSDLELGASFIDSASNDAADRKDELLVFDNLQATINKQPSTTYFRVSGQWRRGDGSTYPTADADEITPSTGLVIRKASTATGETLRWLNTPRY